MKTRRRPRLLAVDDDATWLAQLPLVLEPLGVDLVASDSIDDALRKLDVGAFDVVILDLNFAGDSRSGLDVFRKIMEADAGTDVVVVSAETRPQRIVEVMNAGVTRFVEKASSIEKIREGVQSALDQRERRLWATNLALESRDMPRLIGRSPQMQRLRDDIRRAVDSGVKDILLLGETGTGKEVVAKTIAFMGSSSGRLKNVNCGAIAEGLSESELFGHVKGAFTGAIKDHKGPFEMASGGFVFLDEIGEMPPAQQVKLLRVLQERKVTRVGDSEERDVSFKCIAATHVNIEKSIQEGKFRGDLYYRLSKAVIQIPALRERPEDIPDLVEFFKSQIKQGAEKTFSDSAMKILIRYEWPGNIRQLESVVSAAIYRTDDSIIRDSDIHAILSKSAISGEKTKPFLGRVGAEFYSAQREHYLKVLEDVGGSRDKAAEVLGISRPTFYRRARELGISKRYRRKSIN